MEYCCPVECEEFSVTPVFSPPPVRVNMCPDIAMCPPCLPEGPSIVYRCEKPPEPRYEEKEYGHRPQHDGEKHRSKHCCDSEAHESKPEKRKIYFCCEMAPPKNCSMPPPTKTKKQEVLFCCEVPAPKMSMKMSMAPECCKPKTNKKEVFFCCEEPPKKSYTPPPKDCCIPTKPIKTKYMIPCYRYEDGRVANPSELMRQACAAVGKCPKKPFLESTFTRDHDSIIRKFHCQDGQGNICFHFEKRKKPVCCYPPPCCPVPHCPPPCYPPPASMPCSPLPCVPCKPCLPCVPIKPCLPCKSYVHCDPCAASQRCGPCGPSVCYPTCTPCPN